MSEKKIEFIGDQMGKKVQDLYADFFSEYAKKFDTDISICLCHGKHEFVPNELSFDKFYVFIQLLPKEFEGVKTTKMKGYKLNGKNLVFPVKENKSESEDTCPQGNVLTFTKDPSNCQKIVDENGIVMAVCYDDNLYIANDFIHTRNQDEFDSGVETFNYIIDYAINKTKILSNLKADLETKSKKVLEVVLKNQLKQRLEKELVLQQASKEAIETYQKSVTEAVRKVMIGEKVILSLRENIADIPMALENTWSFIKKLENTEQYSTITFSKIGIKAITKPIYIEFRKEIYDLGRFEVDLTFAGNTKIINLDRRIQTYDHPHVSNGAVCWGNFAGEIPRLIGSCQFDVALLNIHTFLSHYDSASPHKVLTEWPKAPKEVKMEKEVVK